jgi:hypothetical protein
VSIAIDVKKGNKELGGNDGMLGVVVNSNLVIIYLQWMKMMLQFVGLLPKFRSTAPNFLSNY